MRRKSWLLFQTDPDGGSGAGGGTGSGDDPGGQGTTTPPEGEPAAPEAKGGETRMVPESEAQEARREAKNLRDRLKKSEEEKAALEAEKLSDNEKVVKERDDLKKSNKELATRTQTLRVQVLAGKAGIIDPEAASALLDWKALSDPDDDAEVEAALKQLVKDKPYLAGTVGGGSDGGAGDGSGGETEDMNQLIRQRAGRA